MRVVIGSHPLLLSKIIGQGGAGTVYEHPSCSALVVKIYRDLKHCEPERIEWLCAHLPTQMYEHGRPTFAWPIEPAHDANTGEMCGFSMPRVEKVLSLQAIVNPSSRMPAIGRRWLWKVAISFLTRLHTLHLMGHIAGDINFENFLVDRRGIVTEIDLDSTDFKIPGGPRFTTKMNRVELQPAELIGAGHPVLDRGEDQDAWSAFIVVCRLLQEGRHPFDSHYLGSGNPPHLHVRIRDGIWPDSLRHPMFQPKPGPVPFTALPELMQSLLRLMFLDGHTVRTARPTVTDLLNCLVQHQPFGTATRTIGRLAWWEELHQRSRRQLVRQGAYAVIRHKKKVALAGIAMLGIGAGLNINQPQRGAPTPYVNSLITAPAPLAGTFDDNSGAVDFAPSGPSQANPVLMPTPKLWREATDHSL